MIKKFMEVVEKVYGGKVRKDNEQNFYDNVNTILTKAYGKLDEKIEKASFNVRRVMSRSIEMAEEDDGIEKVRTELVNLTKQSYDKQNSEINDDIVNLYDILSAEVRKCNYTIDTEEEIINKMRNNPFFGNDRSNDIIYQNRDDLDRFSSNLNKLKDKVNEILSCDSHNISRIIEQEVDINSTISIPIIREEGKKENHLMVVKDNKIKNFFKKITGELKERIISIFRY